MLRNLTFVVQVAYFSIRPKKVFVLSEQLSLQKAAFDCFFEQLLSNLLGDYGKLFEKSRLTCGKPYPLMKLFQSHAVCNGTEICHRDFIQKVKIELLKEKLLNTPPPLQKKTQKKVFVLTTRRPPLH